METAVRDFQTAIGHAVDQTMLIIDAPRPPSGQVMTQGLWLAAPAVRRSYTFLEECIDLPDDLAIRLLPVEVILPGAGAENNVSR
jgi:hypothetical protein